MMISRLSRYTRVVLVLHVSLPIARCCSHRWCFLLRRQSRGDDDRFSSLSLHEGSVTCYLLHDAVAIVGATSCAHDLAVPIVKQHIGDDDQ